MDHRPYGPGPVERRKRGKNPNAPKFTENQILEFDIINFENYIHFHKTALKKIDKGVNPRSLLTQKECALLLKRGVLLKRHHLQGYLRWSVSPRALEILASI